MSEQKDLRQTASSHMMLQTVANTPGAIGYSGLPSLDTSVHTLAIDGQTTTAEAIAAGKYTFWGYEHMYTMSNNRNSVLVPFLQFMLTPTIQEQAKRMRYIPLTQVQVPATATHT
jgi:phosphate transport system substrate-binding protein